MDPRSHLLDFQKISNTPPYLFQLPIIRHSIVYIIIGIKKYNLPLPTTQGDRASGEFCVSGAIGEIGGDTNFGGLNGGVQRPVDVPGPIRVTNSRAASSKHSCS